MITKVNICDEGYALYINNHRFEISESKMRIFINQIKNAINEKYEIDKISMEAAKILKENNK